MNLLLRGSPGAATILLAAAFPGFLGVFDANGDASMAFLIQPALAPLLLGTTFTFAGVTFAPTGFEAAFGPAKLVLNP